MDPLAILGMNHPEVTFIGNLFIRAKMKQLPALWRNPDLFRVDIHDPQASPHGLSGHAQTRLAFAQCCFGLLAGKRIDEDLCDQLEAV
ncbi:MAG: hypothetical protein MZV49_09815 [Rhodopseudomonas palustris]|nr:hypothetical protein [Rhodopseudomonas palustris]